MIKYIFAKTQKCSNIKMNVTMKNICKEVPNNLRFFPVCASKKKSCNQFDNEPI